jgi:hypothetical protein
MGVLQQNRHVPEEPIGAGKVRSPGLIGQSHRVLESARLTPSRHGAIRHLITSRGRGQALTDLRQELMAVADMMIPQFAHLLDGTSAPLRGPYGGTTHTRHPINIFSVSSSQFHHPTNHIAKTKSAAAVVQATADEVFKAVPGGRKSAVLEFDTQRFREVE